jgi:hypothetical protein
VKWPFGRKQPSALDILKSAGWACNKCAQTHNGIFDIACRIPDPWLGTEEYEPNSALRLEGDFLSEDFCVLGGEHFFVRCVLEIPIHGLPDKFAFGCWGTLKKENFEIFLDSFDAGGRGGDGPWWSWLSNSLPTYEIDEPLGCWMYPQLGRQRPVLRVDDPEHSLAIAQEDGVPPEQLLEIYRKCGHSPAT